MKATNNEGTMGAKAFSDVARGQIADCLRALYAGHTEAALFGFAPFVPSWFHSALRIRHSALG
jgi:hypothetical protein